MKKMPTFRGSPFHRYLVTKAQGTRETCFVLAAANYVIQTDLSNVTLCQFIIRLACLVLFNEIQIKCFYSQF